MRRPYEAGGEQVGDAAAEESSSPHASRLNFFADEATLPRVSLSGVLQQRKRDAKEAARSKKKKKRSSGGRKGRRDRRGDAYSTSSSSSSDFDSRDEDDSDDGGWDGDGVADSDARRAKGGVEERRGGGSPKRRPNRTKRDFLHEEATARRATAAAAASPAFAKGAAVADRATNEMTAVGFHPEAQRFGTSVSLFAAESASNRPYSLADGPTIIDSRVAQQPEYLSPRALPWQKGDRAGAAHHSDSDADAADGVGGS